MRLYRRDVQQDAHKLGSTLGDVLTEQRSDEALDTVGTLGWHLSIPAGDRKSRQSLTNAIADAGPERRLVIARAFTTYFELINLAEERKRVRTLREQAQAGIPDQGLEGWSKEGVTVDTETVHQVIDYVLVQPTFAIIRRNAPQDRQNQTPGHCERPRDAR